MNFTDWWSNFRRTGDICPVRLGCLRSDLQTLWGEPDDTAKREQGDPMILRYGGIEFHFEAGSNGRLWFIYQDTNDGIVQVCIGGALYDAR
jgi:hypothetical protein